MAVWVESCVADGREISEVQRGFNSYEGSEELSAGVAWECP